MKDFRRHIVYINKMIRKTNLFYQTDIDNKLLIFSNYTESMTGNFLATNVKLFPSKFLCLNIPSLDAASRNSLISKLVTRYENRLAFLRDYCKDKGLDIEENIKPLGYLIDTILEFDPETEITFVGQVTEQDYNGIYADTICVIDGTAIRTASITGGDPSSECVYDKSKDYLYGWYETVSGESEYTGPSDYSTVKPVLDTEEGYYMVPSTKSIDIDDDAVEKDIVFNVIIPLYDVINVDYRQNTDRVQDMTQIDCTADDAYILNVPYGIWFADDKITLTRDGSSYGPSWSLSISSQFKPFPYSLSKAQEVSDSARHEAFLTFAEILTRQNSLITKLSDMTNAISNLSSRVSAVESKIANLATTTSIGSIKEELVQMQAEINEIKASI